MRIGTLALVGMAILAARAGAAEEPALKTQQEKLGYAMGVGMAQGLKRQGAEVDLDLVVRGLRDGYAGRKLLLSDDEFRQTMSAYQAERMKKGAPPAKTAAEAKAQGKAFLAGNAKKEGVVSLASGLQYKVLKAGDGKRPTDADAVLCHYRGTFIDGTEFDSSYRRGRPATFALARVIPGWREALKLMPVGSKWQLFVPPQLAYGERGMRGSRRSRNRIGPNATLVFEVELVAVNPPRGSAGTGRATTAASKTPVAPEK